MNNTIVHVLDTFPSKSETFIINHIIECERSGFKSIILANVINPIEQASQKELIESYGLFVNSKSYNSKIPKNKISRSLKAFLILINNLKDYKVFFKTLNQKKFGLKAKTLKLWFQAAIFLKFKSVNVFHGHFGISGKLLSEMKEIGAIKGDIVMSFYGYDTFSTEANRAQLKAFYKDVFSNSKVLVTSSKYLCSNLQKLNAPDSKLVVNAVGVDVNRFQYQKRDYDSTLNIITVGRLIELKGQTFGIDAVILLLKKGYKVNYIIVGYGEDEAKLKKKIESSDCQDNITLYGSASQTEVSDLLYKSHVFLITSVTDSTGRAEGQGLVLAEAQSTGLPILAFDSGGISDSIIANKTGFLVEEKNTNLMAEKLEKFIKNPELINKMGYDASNFVNEQFNSKKQSEKLIEYYN